MLTISISTASIAVIASTLEKGYIAVSRPDRQGGISLPSIRTSSIKAMRHLHLRQRGAGGAHRPA
jgi:hypothetical protein